jgi:hypothetical protein
LISSLSTYYKLVKYNRAKNISDLEREEMLETKEKKNNFHLGDCGLISVMNK